MTIERHPNTERRGGQCPTCGGKGFLNKRATGDGTHYMEKCPRCYGSGHDQRMR